MRLPCEYPALSELPITHWTQRELRDEVIKRGIVDSISESRVGHFLREAALQPHRRKMLPNTKEKDFEQFQQAATTVCEIYRARGNDEVFPTLLSREADRLIFDRAKSIWQHRNDSRKTAHIRSRLTR